MSNNPPLPPPDMDDFEATMIRAQNPPPPGVFKTAEGYARAPLVTDEQIRELRPQGQMAPPIKNRARPRRADREKLFDRDDWKVLAIIMFMAFAAGMFGGAVFLLMINHI